MVKVKSIVSTLFAWGTCQHLYFEIGKLFNKQASVVVINTVINSLKIKPLQYDLLRIKNTVSPIALILKQAYV